MRSTVLKCSVAILSLVSITACSGPGYSGYSYGNQGYSRYGATNVNMVPTYGSEYTALMVGNPYGLQELRGPQPVYYGHNQGTMLRGSAPYGAAVHDAHYMHRNQAVHQNKSYVSIGGIAYDAGNSDMYGIQGRYGYNMHPNFGIESELSGGVASEDLGGGLKLGVDYSVGGFGVARIPLGSSVTLLGRGGYHQTGFKAKTSTASGTLKTDGFAYGVGAEFALDRQNAMRFDYTRYEHDQLNGGTDTASVSYVRKF